MRKLVYEYVVLINNVVLILEWTLTEILQYVPVAWF